MRSCSEGFPLRNRSLLPAICPISAQDRAQPANEAGERHGLLPVQSPRHWVAWCTREFSKEAATIEFEFEVGVSVRLPTCDRRNGDGRENVEVVWYMYRARWVRIWPRNATVLSRLCHFFDLRLRQGLSSLDGLNINPLCRNITSCKAAGEYGE